ncbi:MAG: YlxR family protein [Anaerolineaceae bacterium]|nr:YlxR family protein [Anaerolineaceae bacterium]
MARKSHLHTKHIPQRTCVGCRKTLPKRSLIRLVRTEDGILIDPTGKMPGRGAYLHNLRSCWEAGIKSSLANALKTDLTEDDRVRLQEYSARLIENGGETTE